MDKAISYNIFPLGDTALTVDFGNIINVDINNEVLARAQQLQQELAFVKEVVPAYSSLTVYADTWKIKKELPPDRLAFDHIKEKIEILLKIPLTVNSSNQAVIKIPVCYDAFFASDINALATAKSITVDDVIQIHLSRTYRVFMLGFLPGFAYMGEVDDRISMARKNRPAAVEPGSVGIAGKQTGIYPMASPGGWQIIGRTPLQLFNANKEQPTLLKAGDIVQFFSISKNEFANY